MTETGALARAVCWSRKRGQIRHLIFLPITHLCRRIIVALHLTSQESQQSTQVLASIGSPGRDIKFNYDRNNREIVNEDEKAEIVG